MTRISIQLDEKEIKLLKKRAEKNLLTLNEQIEDIIRRSCVNASSKTAPLDAECDDKLVSIFSRQKKGNKRRKKKSKRR